MIVQNHANRNYQDAYSLMLTHVNLEPIPHIQRIITLERIAKDYANSIFNQAIHRSTHLANPIDFKASSDMARFHINNILAGLDFCTLSADIAASIRQEWKEFERESQSVQSQWLMRMERIERQTILEAEGLEVSQISEP